MSRAETEPLLPRYDDDTSRQRRLHQKIHSYQMLRALSEGYMPSTEQTIANLRTLLAFDIFNPRNPDLGPVGRQLVRDSRLWIQLLIEFLQAKNGDDQLQEFIWHLSHGRATVHTSQLAERASRTKAKADTKAAFDSLRVVGNLLLTNSDFRLFAEDLTTVGREIFSDTAFSLSAASQKVGEQLKPSEEDEAALSGAGADEGHTHSQEELRAEVNHVADVAKSGLVQTGRDAKESAKEHISGKEQETLIHRLKQTVLKLRERRDYTDSVSVLARLLERYAIIYANAATDVASTAEEESEINDDLKQAIQKFWALLQTLGDRKEWEALEQRLHAVLRHANGDPEFEDLVTEIGSAVQEMMTNPDSLDSAPEKIGELKEKSKHVGAETSLRQDVDSFLAQAKRALQSISRDEAISKLLSATRKLYKDALSGYRNRRANLPADLLEVFLPLVLRNIQYIPIPRLEISAPEVDLLIENLILEPGHTVNYSSFLPYRMHVTTRNDIDVVKRHSKKTTTNLKTTFTVSVCGLNVSAQEFGYWLRTHKALFFYLKDQGIASFFLDRRGIDISLDVEVGRERLEQIFTLRGVRVRIHKLDYKVHRGKWRFLIWLTKPFLKHMIRRVLEKQIAEQIVQAAHALNRELVFARERLRAARIASPRDLFTFVRAVLARLTPAPNPDIEARVGIDAPGEGVFKNVYAPGSLVKLWHEEALQAHDSIEEGEETPGLHRTWRNTIFDVPV
ncbi:hypothetical protein ASPCAL00421 [Aspergillus calidoustus]|uniref:HAM1-like N-terminal domain-containing protein n=1 Tax=Aspergillus calidoustus TaxID=454130 RepID=A0A0U5C1D1_ASPCI|nr:hypothetical protein ASPCAL00421 [Aspergillus calidoustus]